MATKVENIDLSGGALLKGGVRKRRKSKAKNPRSKSAKVRKTKSRSKSVKRVKRTKSKSRSKSTKVRKSKSKSVKRTKKTRSTSRTKKSKGADLKMNGQALADNLIQLGVHLKNMNLDGAKKPKNKPKPKAKQMKKSFLLV